MLRAADTICKTDTGRQRRDNEDSAYARAPVFVVADGMGGAQAGEVASRIAVEAFEQGLPDAGSPEQRLAARVREANRQIYERSRADRGRAGMGTTLTAAYLDDSDLAIAHVGDSRAYLFRDGELKRLTQDHSLVDELVRRGKLTEEQAAEHPQRSIITRALGPEPDVEVDTWTYPVRAGDVVLLCSDGLTSMISEERVAAVLAEHDNLDEAADALIEGQRGRRPRQHHGRPVPARGGRRGRRRRRRGRRWSAFRCRTMRCPRRPRIGRPGRDRGGRGAAADARNRTAGARRQLRRPAPAAAPPAGDRRARAPLHQADRRARPSRSSSAVPRRRRLPRDPPAVLHRHQRPGHRHDLPRAARTTSVRGPALRDVLRLGRAGLAHSRPTAAASCSTTTCARSRTRPRW